MQQSLDRVSNTCGADYITKYQQYLSFICNSWDTYSTNIKVLYIRNTGKLHEIVSTCITAVKAWLHRQRSISCTQCSNTVLNTWQQSLVGLEADDSAQHLHKLQSYNIRFISHSSCNCQSIRTNFLVEACDLTFYCGQRNLCTLVDLDSTNLFQLCI